MSQFSSQADKVFRGLIVTGTERDSRKRAEEVSWSVAPPRLIKKHQKCQAAYSRA